MGNLLSRENLLKKEKFEIEKVELGNGDFVFVKQMSGADRDKFEASIIEIKSGKKGEVETTQKMECFRAKLAVVTLCDEEGNLLLEPNDYETLSENMTARTLEKIVNAAQKLNAISDKDKEDLLKN